MLIGELADRTGLTRDTIRYYEKQRLLEPPVRRDNNYKDYPHTTVDRLRFVKALQNRGFTLAEVRDLLSLSSEYPVTCGEVGTRIRVKLDAIDAKIAALQGVKARLRSGFECCEGNAATDTCAPVVEMRLG